MVILRDYIILRTVKGYRVVTATEESCPCCNGKMKVRDTRKRKVIMSDGKEQIFCLRRLKCIECGSVHLEVPDLIIPYKHYAKQVIICAVLSESLLDCPAEDSTIYRWKQEGL